MYGGAGAKMSAFALASPGYTPELIVCASVMKLVLLVASPEIISLNFLVL